MNAKTSKAPNISLIIGLGIPVAMVIFIAVAINWPRWFNSVEPAQFDFLYTVGQQDPYVTHTVEQGRLVVTDNRPEDEPLANQYPTRFFVHDVSSNTNREVKIEEARQLSLDGSVRSPDGYIISSGRRGGWFIFGYWGNNKDRYLVKEKFSEKINLESDAGNNYYYWNFRLIGWVMSANEQ